MKVLEIGCNKNAESSGSEEEEEDDKKDQAMKPRAPTSAPSNPNRQTPTRPTPTDTYKAPTLDELSRKPAHELTRREREAIEKERARQHFLKMKEKEDGARLAVIRKQREEAAAKAAEEKKAKEEARFRKRE